MERLTEGSKVVSHYTKQLELILSKILERKQLRIFLTIATLRYQFCDMTSLKYGGLGTSTALTIRADH